MSKSTRSATIAPVVLAMLAVTSPIIPQARADIVTELGTAGPGQYAILGLNGTDVTLNGPGQTTGNVGVTSRGKAALNGSSGAAIIGNLLLGSTASTSGSANPISGQVSGMILHNQDATLSAASTAANAAGTFFAGLTADHTIATINRGGTTTLTATHSGFYVVHVTGDIKLGNNDNLILSDGGIAGVQFVLNVDGKITLNGGNNFSGGEIKLGGTLTQNNAVINVTSTSGGDNVTASGGSSKDPSNPSNTLPNAQITGILLDLNGGIGLSPGMVNGEIIGGGNEIRLVSGSQDNTQAVPEPSTLACVAAGVLLYLGYAARRRARVVA